MNRPEIINLIIEKRRLKEFVYSNTISRSDLDRLLKIQEVLAKVDIQTTLIEEIQALNEKIKSLLINGTGQETAVQTLKSENLERDIFILKFQEYSQIINECEDFCEAVKDAFFWLPPGKNRDLSYNSKAVDLLKKIKSIKEKR